MKDTLPQKRRVAVYSLRSLFPLCSFLILTALLSIAHAQDATGSLEGRLTDKNGAAVANATVQLKNIETNAIRSQTSDADGFYRLVQMNVGHYVLTVDAPGFGHVSRSPVEILVSQTSRIDVPLAIASVGESIEVTAATTSIDTTTNTLGKVVSGREVLDLPLNGRNFAQLGLLQAGVAPLSAGLATQGGSLRSGQSYAVNGQRPEANNFLLDGVQNVNRMDGGFALKIPIDAIAEFRILTNTAPPEYGANTGSTTSVVTRAGGNQFHGTAYEFFRNDALDTRNYFSSAVEPLKQNQFGVTAGGPIRADRLFFFS